MKTQETINGLHSCKPGNEPIVGQVKTFTVENRTSRNGKPWLKIKSAPLDNGGTPYRIVSAEQTDFVDPHGNLSFNLEIEKFDGGGERQSAVSGEAETKSGHSDRSRDDPPPNSNGVDEARKHLCQAANLYNLCIKCVETMILPNLPEVARTGEQAQATLASMWIYMSSKRSDDNVNWYSYVDKMPDKPL